MKLLNINGEPDKLILQLPTNDVVITIPDHVVKISADDARAIADAFGLLKEPVKKPEQWEVEALREEVRKLNKENDWLIECKNKKEEWIREEINRQEGDRTIWQRDRKKLKEENADLRRKIEDCKAKRYEAEKNLKEARDFADKMHQENADLRGQIPELLRYAVAELNQTVKANS